MRRQATLLITSLAIAGITLLWVSPAQARHPDHGCGGCHVPHGATGDNSEVPLWNPGHSTTTLTGNYTTSQTTDATMSAPDGASKLCLSCHDGTYEHVTAEHSFDSAAFDEGGIKAGSTAGLGSLSSSHPVSFVYNEALATSDGELVAPTTLAADVLDGNGKMQCSPCHDVHSTAADYDLVDGAGENTSQNLRWLYHNSYPNLHEADFCRNCHVK